MTYITAAPTEVPSLMVIEPVPIQVCTYNLYPLRKELAFNRQGIPALTQLAETEVEQFLSHRMAFWELETRCPKIAALVFKLETGMLGIRRRDDDRIIRTSNGGYPGEHYFAFTPRPLATT